MAPINGFSTRFIYREPVRVKSTQRGPNDGILLKSSSNKDLQVFLVYSVWTRSVLELLYGVRLKLRGFFQFFRRIEHKKKVISIGLFLFCDFYSVFSLLNISFLHYSCFLVYIIIKYFIFIYFIYEFSSIFFLHINGFLLFFLNFHLDIIVIIIIII